MCIPSYEQAPTAVLDRLLNLSPEVCSEGELTPTQAWNYIKSQPHFSVIDVQSLRTLTEELCKKIACHGWVQTSAAWPLVVLKLVKLIVTVAVTELPLRWALSRAWYSTPSFGVVRSDCQTLAHGASHAVQ